MTKVDRDLAPELDCRLAVAVAGAVFEFINTLEVLNGVKERHDYYKNALNKLNEKYEIFETIRGEGLLIGCALKDKFAGKAKDINNLAGEEGLLSLIAGPNVVRFTPSLIIPFADIDEGLKCFERALARFVEIQKDEQAA